MKLFAILTAFVAFSASSFADPVNKECPVSGKAVDTAKTSSYKKKITFCCEKCEAKFNAEPDKFAKDIADYKADSGKCLFSGKTGEKSAEYKREVGLCCDKCKAKFDENPDKYIAKAVKK
jgi:YHS domain-containing protein